MTARVPKTSITHPLRVDFVDVPAPGRLGMTFAPGKVQHDAQSGVWHRDLDADLQRLHSIYRTNTLVSVIETRELHDLEIPNLADTIAGLGIHWVHLPVVDGQIPTDEAAWFAAIHTVRARLADAETVVIHCKGGLGRTGTFAASILVSYGIDPATAIASVRAARAETIESGQAPFVARVATLWPTHSI